MTDSCSRPVLVEAARPVVVELVALSVADGSLRSRSTSVPLLPDVAPDDAARSLVPSDEPDLVLHSTSWRCRAGAVVLTYAAFPCPASPDDDEVGEHLVCGTSATRPSAPDPQDTHVAAHAARHLAYLADGRDPHVAQAAARHPAAWRVLRALGDRAHVHADAPVPA